MPGPLAAFGLAVALAAPAATRVHRRRATAAGLIGFGCLAGACWALEPWRKAEREVSGKPFRYRGVVEETWRAAEPNARPAGEILLRLEDAPAASGLACGDRLRIVVWRGPPPLEIGERVELVASARDPRGLCNGGADRAAATARREGLRAEASLSDGRALWRHRFPHDAKLKGLSHWGGAWRSRIRAAIETSLREDEAGVVRALVLGDRRGLEQSVRTAFARTGTAHVLAVSGLHVTMVAAATLAATRAGALRIPSLAARLSVSRLGAIAAMPAVAAYAWLTKPAAPIARAAVTAEIVLAAIALSRRVHFPTALAIAAIAVGLLDPGAPWDLSAQLSFATVLCLWAGSQVLAWRSAIVGYRAAGLLGRALRLLGASLAATLCATIGSAPILARHFGEISLVGLVANPLVVPLMGWGALGWGLAGAVLAPVLPDAARVAFVASGTCVRATMVIVETLAAWPLATIALPWRPTLVAWMALAAAVWPATCIAIRVRRGAVATLVATLFVSVPDLWSGLRISILDVGQGDAALLETAGAGPRLLIDGGGFASGRDPGRQVLLPALRRRSLDWLDVVVVTHPHWDHFGGLETVLRETPVRELWWSGPAPANEAWERLLGVALEQGVMVRKPVAGEPRSLLRMGRRHGRIDVLHPSSEFPILSANESSLVLILQYGAFRALLSGDIEARAEAALVERGGDLGATILKVPHHGSPTSSRMLKSAPHRVCLALKTAPFPAISWPLQRRWWR